MNEMSEKKDNDAQSQKAKVSTAFEEIAERFPRRRYLNKEQKKEIMSFVTT